MSSKPAATVVEVVGGGEALVLGHVSLDGGYARMELSEALVARASVAGFVAARQLADRLHARTISTLEDLRDFARRQPGPVRLILVDESLPDALRAAAPPN